MATGVGGSTPHACAGSIENRRHSSQSTKDDVFGRQAGVSVVAEQAHPEFCGGALDRFSLRPQISPVVTYPDALEPLTRCAGSPVSLSLRMKAPLPWCGHGT